MGYQHRLDLLTSQQQEFSMALERSERSLVKDRTLFIARTFYRACRNSQFRMVRRAFLKWSLTLREDEVWSNYQKLKYSSALQRLKILSLVFRRWEVVVVESKATRSQAESPRPSTIMQVAATSGVAAATGAFSLMYAVLNGSGNSGGCNPNPWLPT